METRQQRRMEIIKQQAAGKNVAMIEHPTYQTLQKKMTERMTETVGEVTIRKYTGK